MYFVFFIAPTLEATVASSVVVVDSPPLFPRNSFSWVFVLQYGVFLGRAQDQIHWHAQNNVDCY